MRNPRLFRQIREQRRGASDSLTEGFQLVRGGIALGLLARFAMVSLISAQLYGVSARDPLSLILVTAFLALISLLACWLAAQRALQVDPAIALRADRPRQPA